MDDPLLFGTYRIQTSLTARQIKVTTRQLEAARQVLIEQIVRYSGGKLWIRVVPDKVIIGRALELAKKRT